MKEESSSTMWRTSRRGFLKGAASVAGAAALGGIPGIVQAAQAPAYPKGTRLHMLQWLNFVHDGDVVFLKQAQEFGKMMGVEVYVERIDQNQVPPRTVAAIEAKSGPDIILMQNNFPHLYAESVADVSDVAEEIGKAQGGYYPLAVDNAYSHGQKRWLAVPQFVFSWAWNYRMDYLHEAGYDKFPETWEQFVDAGRKLKAQGHPIGQSFGHSVNDPNNYVYALLWGWGGEEVEKDGRTVALDSMWTRDAIRFNNLAWKEALDPSGTSWDDSSNNRAFLAGTISITGNSPSIYILAKRDFPEVAKAMSHAPMPVGPGGRWYQLPQDSAAVMKYSKNQKLAKDFISWFMAKQQYAEWFHAMDTFAIPPTTEWYHDPLWLKDPKTTVFREVIKTARAAGYAGPADRQASQALSQYILVDMFVRSMSEGESPEVAATWGAKQLQGIYV